MTKLSGHPFLSLACCLPLYWWTCLWISLIKEKKVFCLMPDFLSPKTSNRKISKDTLFVCLDDYFIKQKNIRWRDWEIDVVQRNKFLKNLKKSLNDCEIEKGSWVRISLLNESLISLVIDLASLKSLWERFWAPHMIIYSKQVSSCTCMIQQTLSTESPQKLLETANSKQLSLNILLRSS